jgi:hypothetical protein
MLYDTRINRRFLRVFYALCAAVLALFGFMQCRLRLLRPAGQRVPVDDWDKAAPLPMYAAAACLVLAVVAFVFALWPCFQLATFAIGALGFMTVILVGQWLPI